MTIKKVLAATLLAALSSTANAGTFHFTGNIVNHNDVIITTFTLNQDAANVRVWTDSFGSYNGINFDPITALWNAVTGALISQNDDNAGISPATQNRFDSGFTLPTLPAGTYFFTVATFDNWASGQSFSQGFLFDNQTPIPISQWNQPSNTDNLRGSYWSVWLDGVDSATNPDDQGSVPEPMSLALVGTGLTALALNRRTRRTA